MRRAVTGAIRGFRAVDLTDGLPPLGEEALVRPILGYPPVLAVPASGQTVYRLLGKSEPRDWDFQSDRDKGRARGPRQDVMDHVGLSVFGRPEAALVNAVRWPKFLATVRLDGGHGFMVARTLAEVSDHYCVWGEPATLLAAVVRVQRFDESE